MKPPAILFVDELNAEPYASIVCYPRASALEMEERFLELRRLGIERIEFDGKASAFSIPVLGKGYVGIVVKADIGVRKYALKMQRVDSGRENLLQEAELLQLANTVGVGPKYFASTKHFLLMELVDGGLLEEWLLIHTGRNEVQLVVRDILEQCWRLDEIGLDHGELSKAPKHLLLNAQGKPFIVDFETASTCRNASNVTSVCQYLFLGQSQTCRAIAQTIGEIDRERLVDVLKNYRRNRNRQSFDTLKRLCLN